ncbi:MAG: carbohydrate binding domain-containing protein [Candidatus Heimdallarchaeota archaeon]|nr:carbohydrate binding domain-containing protein [Candidatus Heimdallarchaeota archaeon]
MPAIGYANMYEFHIDPDKLSGAPVVKLNEPITEKDIIHSFNGHFYTVGIDLKKRTKDDVRIRFWGINLSPPLVFPRSVREAERLASRLSKLGFNIVRIHGLDYVSNKQYKSVFSTNRIGSFPGLSNANLHALDILFDALQKYGVYVDLVLKDGYTFDTEHDCYFSNKRVKHCIPDPELTTQSYPLTQKMTSGSRPLDLFNHEMIELQKLYFKELLERYKSHPVLALIEINNENSLIEYMVKKNGRLPSLYAEELDRLWDSWLVNKYGNTAVLQTAWSPDSENISNLNMIKNGDFSEHFNGRIKYWAFDQWELDGFNNWGAWKVGSDNALEIEINNIPKKYWYFFFGQRGLLIEKNHTYRLQFTARADVPRKIKVAVQGMGQNKAANAIPNVREVVISKKNEMHTICFTSSLSDSDARLTFLPTLSGETIGKFWLDNVSLTPDAARGLELGTFLSVDDPAGRGNIMRPGNMLGATCPVSEKMLDDYYEFLAFIERSYYQQMVDYIKNNIGISRPITGTQANYGGLLSHRNMSDIMDYIDVHFYWDQPHIPKNNQKKWWMNNKSMIKQPLEGIVARIAEARVAGKPFTISEYSPNQLNQYAHEELLITAAYSALQDIDGVFLFSYYKSGGDTRDRMRPKQQLFWYNVLGDTRAEALMHVASNIFRRSDVNPAKSSIQLHVNHKIRMEQARKRGSIRNIAAVLGDCNYFRDKNKKCFNMSDGLSKKIELIHNEKNNPMPRYNIIYKDNHKSFKDANELLWKNKKGNRHVSIDTPNTQVVAGKITQDIILSDVTVSPLEGSNNSGTVAITSLDNRPINEANNLLVTSIGRGFNRYLELIPGGDGYTLCVPDKDKRCSKPFWDSASGPFIVESNLVTIRLKTSAETVSVFRLDNTGVPAEDIEVKKVSYGYDFIIGKTPWYQVSLKYPIIH